MGIGMLISFEQRTQRQKCRGHVQVAARDTDRDDLRSAGIVMDGVPTISLCRFRRMTFLIEYAHAAGTPPLACIPPSAGVRGNSSAAFAGSVAEYVYVTT